MTAGCAYFNTYYNAETAYKNARKGHEEFLSNQQDTAGQVPEAVMSNYDRAIEKSRKLIEVYPKSKKWHDDALFLMGRAEFYKQEHISAVRRFKQLQREFPQSEYIPQSFLYMGKAYLGAGDLMRAEKAFRQILTKHPHLNDKEKITLLLAQVAIRREGKAQAIRLLEKTLLTVKTPEKRMEISIQIANLYMELRQFDKAIAVLKKAPRKKEFRSFLYQIDYAMLICYKESEKYQEALKLSEEMIRNKKYLHKYPHVALEKGIVLGRVEKIDEAVGLLEEVTSGEGPAHVKGKAHLELGLLYQNYRQDLDKAREHYGKAFELVTDDELKELALSRRDAIDELKRLREELQTAQNEDVPDTSGRYSTIGYRIGEIFWLSLDEPDSALHYFALLEQNAGEDSISVAKSLYARGWIHLHIKKDTTVADSLFNQVINRYSRTVFAQKSQQQLGQDVTIMTRQDSAYAAFLTAERLYFEENDPVASTNAYIKVATTYKDLPVAATSLYAAAWLCDNVLHKNVTARTLYNKLCETFPDHELVSKIQPRLAVVEDTLRSLGRSVEKPSQRPIVKKPKKGSQPKHQFEDVEWGSDEEPPPLPALPGNNNESADFPR